MISLAGSVSAQSETSAVLESFPGSPETEKDRFRGALFNGMTHDAFKLGTTLSLGWFWMRTDGCSALYRGLSMDQIDFTNILEITSLDAEVISPAGYVPHDVNTTYFYVVRRFNSCGYQEHTLAAATKVTIDADDELLEPQPNKVFTVSSEQAEDNRILLTWFYCPLDQQSQPVCFKVYYDNGTGQVDYQTPLASIGYHGRKFYSYRTDTLQPGSYMFAVSAENSCGMAANFAQLAVQVNAASPDTIEILSAGCF